MDGGTHLLEVVPVFLQLPVCSGHNTEGLRSSLLDFEEALDVSRDRLRDGGLVGAGPYQGWLAVY